ncbi:MAG TPA: PspC domain-containing protein [Steroidobacteraceae bacterium]|jgi:phage shock protein C|nr:PspC domain-containing protein [Steroidobacteraceae bacterium]
MSIAEELERLQALHDRGTISDEEFARAKASVLDEPASSRSATHRSFLHQLARSRSDRVIGGVCGGLGHNTDLPSWAWRVMFCLTLLYFGVGLVIYILLWIFLPEEQ